MRKLLGVLVGALLSASSGITSAAQVSNGDARSWTFTLTPNTYVTSSTIPNPDGMMDDEFGSSVAVSGRTVLVGAPLDDEAGTDAGAAYLMDLNTGARLLTLLNPTPDRFDSFGRSVAIVNSNFVVGADGDHSTGNGGAVHVFDHTGALLRTLVAPTPSSNFGWDVYAYGGNLLTVSRSPASAYLFDVVTGTLLRTFPAPTSSGGDFVSIVGSGGYVVVGSVAGSTTPDREGAVLVYDGATGALLRSLTHPAASGYTGWGTGIAVSNNLVIVGSSSDNTGAPQAGATYVFDITTGALLLTIPNPSPAEFELFGTRVAALPRSSGGTVLLVAAPLAESRVGAVYLFDSVDGHTLQEIVSPLGSYSIFGNSLSIAGFDFVVGAPTYPSSGTVLIYGIDTDGDGLSDRNEVALGTSPTNPDSDGDSLSDGEEVLTFGTNPLDADTDRDALPDPVEVSIGATSAVDPDSDLDGLIDGRDVEWLQAYFDALPPGVYRSSASRDPHPPLKSIEQHIAAGRVSSALLELAQLRRTLDGCGVEPDSNDMIVNCPEQLRARSFVDLLISNLQQ